MVVAVEASLLIRQRSCQECCAPTCFNVTCMPNYVKVKANVAAVSEFGLQLLAATTNYAVPSCVHVLRPRTSSSPKMKSKASVARQPARHTPAMSRSLAVQAGRLSRIFLCKVVSRARAHWGFANSKLGQNPLAPPSRNLIHADQNVLPTQACGDKCVFCMCVQNMRVRRVHIGVKASTYVSVMRLCAG